MFIRSYVYNVGAVCLAPSGATESLPCPEACVGHLHGDRNVTMVITCSFQFTHCALTSSSCPYSVCRWCSKDLGSVLNPQMAQVRSLEPVMRWHPNVSRAMQVTTATHRRRWRRRTTMWSGHVHHERLTASKWLRACMLWRRRSCLNTNTTCATCATCGTCGTHVHAWSYLHNQCLISSLNTQCRDGLPSCLPAPTITLSPTTPSSPFYKYIQPAPWWYATRAIIFSFSSGSTQKLLSLSPADTSNLLERDTTNMADEGTMLGANRAPI